MISQHNNWINTCLAMLCCLFGAHTGFGQNSAAQAAIADSGYLQYYRAIALAEEDVVNNKYHDAVIRYQNACSSYAYNNPVDCYVAAQVASYVGDTASCITFICMGLRFGLSASTIAGNPHLLSLFGTIDRHTIDSLKIVHQQSINHNARRAMLALIKYDQSIVRGLAAGEHIYNGDGYTLKDEYRPIWDSLVNEVVRLTHSYGFPAQKIIGTQNGDDSLFRTGPNATFANYIFIHHTNAWPQVGSLLWAELINGNITPQAFGLIYDHSSGKSPEDAQRYYASRPCQNRRCEKFVNEHIRQVDASRWEIGLGSYRVMQQKFESRARYYKWINDKPDGKKPYFDFECDLNFQGI